MTGLHCPLSSKLVGCITDRKDFYHQSLVSLQRAHSNCLPFFFDRSDFSDDDLAELHEFALPRRYRRELHGDGYFQPHPPLLVPPGKVVAGFGSLFQGDHLGVEYALSSHQCLLQRGGLLDDSQFIRGRKPFPVGPVWQSLVIDDFFSISRETASSNPEESKSVACWKTAKQLYKNDAVLGSDEKDIVGSDDFQVIGSEIDSSDRARSLGLISVGAPLSKRLALSALTLKAAALPVISRSLASRLAGNWTSVLMFRRCATCVLDRLYAYGLSDQKEADHVLALPRSVAQELVLASVIGIISVTNISAEYLDRLFATDASMAKGAVCSKQISPSLAKALWLGGDKRGCFTKLDPPFRAIRRAVGDIDFEDGDDEVGDNGPDFGGCSPPHVLDFSFDFVEICGGSGVVSKAAAELGLNVCVPIDLDRSPWFDLEKPELALWIVNMIRAKRFKSVFLSPPCTTFSPAAHPCVRSYCTPFGFNPRLRKTRLGNILALRCLLFLFVAGEVGAPCLLEQPRLSKMAWLKMWRRLLKRFYREAVIASCQFGSPHRKEFRVIGKHIDFDFLDTRCPGGHKHIPIAGALTKPSAIYVPALARHFAIAFKNALRVCETDQSLDRPRLWH